MSKYAYIINAICRWSWIIQGSYPFLDKNVKDFQGHISHFSRTPFSSEKSLESVFFSSTTAWAILSWRSFILGTWEAGLDKVSTEIQGLSSTDWNFQGLSRPWTFYFKFKGLSRTFKVRANPDHYKMTRDISYPMTSQNTFLSVKGELWHTI